MNGACYREPFTRRLLLKTVIRKGVVLGLRDVPQKIVVKAAGYGIEMEKGQFIFGAYDIIFDKNCPEF